MAKKIEDEEVIEAVEPMAKPNLVGHDFHREDLNELRDAVNYLLTNE